MKISDWLGVATAWVFVLIAAIMLSVGLAVAIPNHIRELINWSGWVAAIGTVAAFAGTIWIATSEQRRRRDQALLVAKVAAASMTFRVATIAKNLQAIAELFDEMSRIDRSHEVYISKLPFLKDQPSWDPAELALLAPLPNDCAYKLAGGLDRLAAATTILSEAINDPLLKSDPEFRKRKAKFISCTLNEAALSLERASQMMQSEIHGHTSPYG